MKSEEFVEMVEKKDGISEFLKGERLSFCLFRGGPKREIVPLKGKSCLVLEELTKVGQAIELRSSRSNLPAGSSTDSSFSGNFFFLFFFSFFLFFSFFFSNF